MHKNIIDAVTEKPPPPRPFQGVRMRWALGLDFAIGILPIGSNPTHLAAFLGYIEIAPYDDRPAFRETTDPKLQHLLVRVPFAPDDQFG